MLIYWKLSQQLNLKAKKGGCMKKVTWIFVLMLFGFFFSQTVFAQESETPDEQKEETEKKMVGPWKNFNVNLGVNITDLNSIRSQS